MNVQEHFKLAPITTFGVGGEARFFIQADTETDIEDAIAFAKTENLPLFVLGNGSNVLVPDSGVEGMVMKLENSDITFEDENMLVAGAGAQWEKIVDTACEQELFGIENLAGIPGTAGGAVVQNIGAYGAELADVFEYADVINAETGERKRVNKTEAEFAYRSSFFKKHRELVVMRVALRLSKQASPNLNHPDLKDIACTTPTEIADAIRSIRAKKFPYAEGEGTAGSFFKNPVISSELAGSLAEQFNGLPVFPQEGNMAKISLAWLLDHALSLKGFSRGNVRLYESQPLVIVAQAGATATEVSEFADEIAERVFNATGMRIEREVETFGAQKEI